MTLSSAKNHLSFLPYDILYQVIGHLGLSDFHNLSRADRTLYNLLQNEQLAKHSIKKHIRYSKEAKWALEGKISYRQAVDRFHNVRHAISTAEPYAAAVLARAATFLYREGVLSYVFNNEIRVLNVHQSSRTEQVVDIHVLLHRMFPACRPCCGTGDRSTQITFLYYSSGILAFLVELNGNEQAWLILLDVSPGCTRRVKYMTRLRSTRRLFVRHNANHLFYGVYSAEYTSCGSYYWAVFWADLKKSSSRAQPPAATLLYGLSGTEIGHNICFEIFDNHFYAVSNVNDSEEEILNWRSYYECACIPPGWDQQKPPKRRIWRRDHLEGPINDTWTEMSLRVDETTGEAMILECRREWREGRSDHVRTYYAERLDPLSEWDNNNNNNNNNQEAESAELPVMQAQPTSSSSASFQIGTGPFNITLPRLPLHGPSDEDLKRRERKDKYVHSEYTSDNCTRREFILARTKFRTYHLSGQAFIDLVNDPEPNNRVGAATDRLRLRVNSRKRTISDSRDDSNSDTDGTNPKVKRVKIHNDLEEASSLDASSVRDNEEFSNHVRLWPPDNADERLIKLLCPTRRANNIYAFADERTMIYSVDTETPQEQAIVIISFDPQIWFPCMRSRSRDVSGMHSTSIASCSSASSGLSLLGPENPKESNKQNKCSIPGPSSSSTPCNGAGAGNYQSSVRSELAMHISIDQGYWFDVKR